MHSRVKNNKRLYTILLVPYITIVIEEYKELYPEEDKILPKENFSELFLKNIYLMYYRNSYKNVFRIIKSLDEIVETDINEVPQVLIDKSAFTAVDKVNILSILGTNNISAFEVIYNIDMKGITNNLYHNYCEGIMKTDKKNIDADFIKSIEKIKEDAFSNHGMVMQVPMFLKGDAFNIRRYATYDLFSHIAHIVLREAYKSFLVGKIYLARSKPNSREILLNNLKKVYTRYSSFNFVRPLPIKIKHEVSKNRVGLAKLQIKNLKFSEVIKK